MEKLEGGGIPLQVSSEGAGVWSRCSLECLPLQETRKEAKQQQSLLGSSDIRAGGQSRMFSRSEDCGWQLPEGWPFGVQAPKPPVQALAFLDSTHRQLPH